jgi:hypothetical protein
MDMGSMNTSNPLCSMKSRYKSKNAKTSDEERCRMLKLIGVICVCLATFPLFSQAQAQPKYEVATIMDVKVHEDSPSDVVRYDVTVKVGRTIYLVLFTSPDGTNVVKYAAGREMLVLVGKKTITYNDMLGQSWEVPIVSQRSATKEAK